MTNRVHIDAPAGVVEIEGEKEFVEGLLAKLFPLLEEAALGVGRLSLTLARRPNRRRRRSKRMNWGAKTLAKPRRRSAG